LTLRIAYAGIIQLIARFATLITGLIFITLVTRNLPVDEFGLWQTLGSSVGLLLIPLAPLNYWTLRYSARGQDVARTSLVAGIISVPIFVITYLVLALTASSSIEAILIYVLIYSIQIPALCIWEVVKPVARSYKPEYLGYATIALEIGKISGAYYTIAILKLGLIGAILSLALGQFLQLAIVIYIIRPKLRGSFNSSTIKKWYKAAWIPISNISVSRLSISDSILVAIILGSTTVVGMFQVGRVFTLIVRYSEEFLRVLYPKLIRDKRNEDITLTFRLQSFVVIPLAVGAMMLAEPLLGILGEQYVEAKLVLRILTIVAVIEGIEYFMWNILTGLEKIDENINNLQFKKLRNSWLVRLPLIDLIKYTAYFSILGIIMYTSKGVVNELTLSVYWAITLLSITIPVTIYKILLARRTMQFEFPKLSILRYSFSGIIMAGFLYVYQELIPLTGTSVGSIIIYIIPPGFISALIYGIIVLSIDSFIRESTIDFIKKIRS
jgi:O-antigen/teichoic acid export membrane protein